MNFTEEEKPFVSIPVWEAKGVWYPTVFIHIGFQVSFDMLILLLTVIAIVYRRSSPHGAPSVGWPAHLESTHVSASVPCQKWQSETISNAPKVSSALFFTVHWEQRSLKQIWVTARSTRVGDSSFSQGWSTLCFRQPTSKVFKWTMMALSSEQDTTGQNARSLI